LIDGLKKQFVLAPLLGNSRKKNVHCSGLSREEERKLSPGRSEPEGTRPMAWEKTGSELIEGNKEELLRHGIDTILKGFRKKRGDPVVGLSPENNCEWVGFLKEKR